ncbi:hypothetical protein EUGRSUZ_G03278 [Eucalyptus grandis]|uniref:Uncharacterized protein n=2 Tax=Eucalyptus grandis TaxID=71139 RepID=A0A059BIR7_EUCGR|nr:hypothetical protein EUGRSUZ_G03278 [Eucalyptus grandis]
MACIKVVRLLHKQLNLHFMVRRPCIFTLRSTPYLYCIWTLYTLFSSFSFTPSHFPSNFLVSSSLVFLYSFLFFYLPGHVFPDQFFF